MIYVLAVTLYILPIIFFFKSNVLKILLLTFSYPIALIFLINNGVDLGRIVSSIGLSYYSEYITQALVLTTLSYALLLLLFWRIRNETFHFEVIKLGYVERTILFFVFIAISCVAFPRAMGVSEIRYNLLPGSWGGVFNVLSIIIIYTARKPKDILTILVYIVIAKCFIAGERADTSIAILLAFILKNSNGIIVERSIGNIKFLFLCFIAICIGVLAGAYRTGVNYSNVFEYLVDSIFGIGTVIDVIHVFLSSFWYVDNYGNNIDVIMNIVYTIIPFVDGGGVSSEYNFTWLLDSKVDNVGGGLFYTPFYMAFSSFGVLAFITTYFGVVKYSFLSSKQWVKYIFIIMIVMQCRIQWYGITYPFTSIKLIFFIVFLMLFLKKISHKY